MQIVEEAWNQGNLDILDEYYAADTVPFDQDAFAIAIARSDPLRFMLADGLALMQSDYPVREIWQRHRAQENIASIPALDDCEYLCIHRQQHEPLVTTVSASMYRLLETVQQGCSLEQLGEFFGEQLPGLLPVAVQNGWIRGFSSAESLAPSGMAPPISG